MLFSVQSQYLCGEAVEVVLETCTIFSYFPPDYGSYQ